MGMDGQHPYRLQIGNYRLLKKISAGTTGIVYQGQHNIFTDEPLVAIKQLRAQLNSPREQASFVQEARLLRRLKHKHILPIIDAGTAPGFPYIVMEYAAGGSLRDLLERQKGQPLSLQGAVKMLAQLASALHYAHEQGIVHRDLKPENILFSAQGDVLLADFGIAVILASADTLRGGTGGTPLYMAPEQFEGIISTRCDQYALGCIAYELLTGHKIFDPPSVSLATLWYHHTKVDPIPPCTYNPALPAPMDRVLLKALAKKRAERFEDVQSFIDALYASAFPETTTRPTMATATLPTVSPSSDASPLFTDEPEALLKQGEALLQQHKYVAALSAYTKAARILPQSLIAWLGKAYVQYKLKLYDKALASYTEALHLDPRSVPALEGKGHVLCGQERYEEALVAYIEALRVNPQYAPAHRNRGNVFLLLRHYQDALNEYEKALQIDGLDAESWQNKGTALFWLKRHREALAASEQALQLNPELAVARQNKILVIKELRKRSQ
ncbi:MAG TPA: serine/threonine-protein kinase [Ktedonobacteraceae bacterium]